MNNKDASYKNYMARIGAESIPCYEPSLGEEELGNLSDVIKRGWLSENKYTREFETRLASYCKRDFSLAFNNATAALIVGMKCLGIGDGDEVITPSFTHTADPNSIAATGAKPVFAEVELESMCLSLESIRAKVTDKTKAVLYVALYGNCGDLESVSKYCKEQKLFLIIDSAAALGSLYKGHPISSFGDFSVLSFFSDKTITTGEGGMLLTDNPSLLGEANIYKHDGRKERGVDLIERKGFNFRITELQTAVGCAQLNKLDYFISRKKQILLAYQNGLKNIKNIHVFKFNDDVEPVPHRVVIFAPNATKLINELSKNGIGVRTTFMPMHSQPIYLTDDVFPNTQKLYETGVCLPSAPSLRDEDIDFVINTIKNFYEGNNQ